MTTQEFKENVLPLRDKLFRFAYSYVKDYEEARDVVQDVMVKCWQSIDDLARISNVEAWCMTLTKNRSLDLLRKKGRNPLDISEQYDLMSKDKDPLLSAGIAEAGEYIQKALDTLPDKQRQVIVLRDIEGHTYQEIAEILDIKLNDVKVSLYRGRLKLKELLERVYKKDRNL